jgi:large subunit ribosomal protein L17
MRHGVSGRKFNRNTGHRTAMFRNLTQELLRHGRIQTTEPKAKEIRPMAEKIITLGKDGSLHARRQALAFIYDPEVVAHVFAEIAPRYADRKGGYTRIVKLGPRLGDGADMAMIELV